METAVTQQRRRVLYTGRVQGVGFRANAEACSRPFAVSGFVRNLPDGRVELVAEGEASDLDAFLDHVTLSMRNHIRDQQTETLQASGEYEGFTIRY